MIKVKYFEEAEEGKPGKDRFAMVNMLAYDGESNDFEFIIHGERLKMAVTGSQIHKENPHITEVKIIRDYNGLVVEYLDEKHMVHYRKVINTYSFDWFDLRSLVKPKDIDIID